MVIGWRGWQERPKNMIDILIHVKLGRTLTRRNARAVRSSASSPGSQVESWLYTWTSGPGQVKIVIFLSKKGEGPFSIKLSCLEGHWIYAALCNTNLLSIIIFQVIWRKGLQESPVRLLRSHSWPFSRIFTLFSLSDICLQFFFYRLEYEEECKWIRRWVAR